MKLASRPTIIIALLILIAATCLTFWPVIDNGFATRDEYRHVVHNPLLRVVSWQNMAAILDTHYYRAFDAPYMPLTFLMHGVEYHIAGLDPHLYHAMNLLLHVLITLLVCYLTYLMTGSIHASIAAAFLFSLHPLQAETIACTDGRKELLMAFFFLLALVFYIHYAKNNSRRCYFLSLGFFIAAAASAPWALIFPLLLPAVDYRLNGSLEARHLRRSYPFIAVSLIALLLTIQTIGCLKGGKVPLASSMPLFYNISSSSTIALRAVAELLLPPSPAPHQQGVYWYAPLLLAALLLLFIIGSRRWGNILFPGLFFFIALIPSLDIFCSAPPQSLDVLMYLPSAGLFMLGGICFDWIEKRACSAGGIYGALCMIVLIVLLSLLSLQAHRRCTLWKDSDTLARGLYGKTGKESESLQRRRAFEKMERMIGEATDAISRRSTDSDAYVKRAMLFYQSRALSEALSDLNEAILLNPGDSQAFFGRALVHKEFPDPGRALKDMNRALELEPHMARGYNVRGIMYAESGRDEEALADFARALQEQPGYGDALINRGTFYARKGEHDRALADFDNAVKVDPVSLSALYRRAALLHAMKDDARSGKDLEKIRSLSGTIDWATLQGLARDFSEAPRR
jgi:protein O-mannosyl-transferase